MFPCLLLDVESQPLTMTQTPRNYEVTFCSLVFCFVWVFNNYIYLWFLHLFYCIFEVIMQLQDFSSLHIPLWRPAFMVPAGARDASKREANNNSTQLWHLWATTMIKYSPAVLPACSSSLSVEPAASLPSHQAFLSVLCNGRCCWSSFCCSFLSCGRKWEQEWRNHWRQGILAFGNLQAYVQAVLPPPLKTPGKSRISIMHFPILLYAVN